MKHSLAISMAVALTASPLMAAPTSLLRTPATTPSPFPSSLKTSSGSLETFKLYSPELERDVTVDVYLPDGYSSRGIYPVVYMHDGQNLFDPDNVWNHQEWGIDEAVAALPADVAKPIVVGVYSVPDTRVGDMMPTEPLEGLERVPYARDLAALTCAGGIKGDKYVDFIATTLKHNIDSLYATYRDPAHTSVMGSSMGGLASFYALCRHPEVFGSAACLSTHWIGGFEPNEMFPTAFADYLLKNFPLDGAHRIYIDTGDADIDSNYVPYHHRVIDMLKKMGLDDTTLMHGVYEGQNHSENSWASRVATPLRFLLTTPGK